MELSQTIRPGVGQYISQPNALDLLDDKLSSFQSPFVISGQKSFAHFQKFYRGNRITEPSYYDGTASLDDIERLKALTQSPTDLVIGIGGGKVADTAKAVAGELNVPCITIPTNLGSCAPATPHSILYDKQSRYECSRYYERHIHLCLVDLNMLNSSPIQYFKSGIGDTLAKWFEAQAIAQQKEGELSSPILLGLEAARLTRDILFQLSKSAVESMSKGELSDAFSQVVDCILVLAAAVGGFAGDYGRVSGAHAIHNGMTQISDTKPFLHGIKVAYGILVQLQVLEHDEEMLNLLKFYRNNQFPTKLSDFGIKEDFAEKTKVIAAHAASASESFHLAVPNITDEMIVEAIYKLENT